MKVLTHGVLHARGEIAKICELSIRCQADKDPDAHANPRQDLPDVAADQPPQGEGTPPADEDPDDHANFCKARQVVLRQQQ